MFDCSERPDRTFYYRLSAETNSMENAQIIYEELNDPVFKEVVNQHMPPEMGEFLYTATILMPPCSIIRGAPEAYSIIMFSRIVK